MNAIDKSKLANTNPIFWSGHRGDKDVAIFLKIHALHDSLD
jgi:hypothetical protein